MKPEWMDSPKFTVHTSFGSAECTATDEGHVYADANSNGKALEYRGKRYPMTFHFNLYPDLPSFQLTRDERGNTHHAVYGDVPPSFKVKIAEAVMVAVNAYLRAHPEVLVEAEVVSANNDLMRVEEKLEEARVAYGKALDANEAAVKRLARAKKVKP